MIADLRNTAKQWMDEAVAADASAYVRENAFKEVTGKSVREYFGDAEIDRRMEEGKRISRNAYGI